MVKMKNLKNLSDSEIYKIYDAYFWNKSSFEITYLCGNISSEERLFVENIVLSKELLIFDAPDGIIKLKDKTIIIEHFKIDASKSSKRGTLINKLTRGNTATFDREIMLNELPANITSLEGLDRSNFREKIKKYSSYDNLISNFVNSYLEHYSKIETYKSNILASNEPNISKDFNIAFFVEDVTPIDQLIPNFSSIETEAIILEKQRNNICTYVNRIKDISIDHIFFFSKLLNKPRIFYANKKMIVDLKMLPANNTAPSE